MLKLFACETWVALLAEGTALGMGMIVVVL